MMGLAGGEDCGYFAKEREMQVRILPQEFYACVAKR
jgi:hypothetical protein